MTLYWCGQSFILPQWLLTGSIGWIAGMQISILLSASLCLQAYIGFGQAGSALLPFMTGALANKFGINSLQPL